MKNVNLVKSIFSHTQKALFMSLVLILLVTTGCQNSDELKTKNEITSAEKYSNIPVEETMSFEGFASIAKYDGKNVPTSFEGKTIVQVIVTPRILFLPKDHPKYDDFYQMLSKQPAPENLFKVIIHDKAVDGIFPIVDIKVLPTEKQQELRKNYSDEELSQEEGNNARSLGVISMSQATNFFNDMKNLRCDLINQCPCIPFQYAGDGCFARAHAMRKEFKARFGFDCQKIFSYGNPIVASVPSPLNCTATWNYHVAPLVQIQTSSGPKNYVIDPGLFTGPVTATAWLNHQGTNDYRTKSGNYYVYNKVYNGLYYYYYTEFDDDYSKTNVANNITYTFQSGCNWLV